MSEAELHQIRQRLHQGERQKAARGELRLSVPAGLAHDRSGQIILNTDEEVQARLGLVFAKFRERGSARAVMRYLRKQELPLPVRPLLGPAPHDIVWREASNPRVLSILHNPGYAGAYVYGRRRLNGGRVRHGVYRPKTTKVPVADWEVCLQAAHPGYISWGGAWRTRDDWRTISTATKPAIRALRAREWRCCRASQPVGGAVAG